MANEYDEAVRLARGAVERDSTGDPPTRTRIESVTLARAVLAMAKRLERPTTESVAESVAALRARHDAGGAQHPTRLSEAADLLESLARRVAELEAERRDVETERADVVAFARRHPKTWADLLADDYANGKHVGAAGKETGK